MKYGKKLVLFSLFAMNLVVQPTPVVEIEQGVLSGIVSADGKIFEYIGIPYATANSSNRFQAPLPAPKWEGVYRATKEFTCPQHLGFLGVLGTEDCLKVNVYVPAMSKKPMPVMVFIHGGAFIIGSGGKLLYGPDLLVRHNVILVTINYRLGVLGFLCLGIKEAPGNAGLKDQIAALKWVKRNIAAFGGDPDNVTIFGESAGGTSTSLLLASEATTGLFERAIIQSGSSLSIRAVSEKPVKAASALAKKLGFDTQDPHEIYEIFSNISYKRLLTVKAAKTRELYFDTEHFFLPCVEKAIPGVERALTDLPYNLLSKKPLKVPVIYGSNSKEGLFLISGDTKESLEVKNYNSIFPSDLEVPSKNIATSLDIMVKKFYFGNEHISEKTIMNVLKLYTHLFYEIPEILETELILQNTEAKVYNYIFNYTGSRNLMKNMAGFGKETGASHGDDIFYLFTALVWPFSPTKDDQLIIDWLTRMWTNFAKFGNPTPFSDLPVKWTPSSKGDMRYLYVGDKLEMGPIPNPEAYEIWRDIYRKYRRKNIEHYVKY